jgi:lipopolysaccharide export system permease protein
MTLRVEESFDQGADLRGVFVRAADEEGRALAVSAARGQFLQTDDPDTILLRLRNGTLVHDASREGGTPRVLTFVQHDLPVGLPPMERFRERGGRNLELTIPELVQVVRDPMVDSEAAMGARATFHRRAIQVVAMFVLPFLAVALAVPPKRSTSSLGVFLSIVILVTYHKITEYGERMGAIGRVDPMLAQWVPFVLFAGLCLWLYYILAYRPGGQPIGALERGLANIGKSVRRLLPGPRRRPAGGAMPAPAAE